LPLTALLIIDDADSAFTVLGVPIVEFQIRQAVYAGAQHILLMVERMPRPLLECIDRLRRGGLAVDVARNAHDAIDFVHPDDRVLMIAPRVAVAPADAAILIGSAPLAVLEVSVSAATARLDIIDARRRWTGWAAFDGRFLREVGSTIGDWDLAPTILRQLLQAGGVTTSAEAAIYLIDRPDDRRVLESSLRESADTPATGIGEALVTRPAARLGASLLADSGIRADWIGNAALALAVAAAVLGFTGWVTVSVAVMLVARTGWRIASILSAAVAGGAAHKRSMILIRDALLATTVVAAGLDATQATGQWGCLVLAIATVAALALLRTPLARSRTALTMADFESSLVLIGFGALIGAPAWGLGLAALHAALSVAARQTTRPAPQP